MIVSILLEAAQSIWQNYTNLGGTGYVVSYIGQDTWGIEICEYMERQKLPLDCVKNKGENRLLFGFVESDGERTF